jgi:acyl carrier protein
VQDDLAFARRDFYPAFWLRNSYTDNKGSLVQMNTTDIDRDIRAFLFLFGRAEALRDGEPLQGNVIDSTGALELVAYLQEHFGITVEDDEVIPENLESVNKVVAYVAGKLAAKA